MRIDISEHRKEFLPDITQGCKPDSIFNDDEIGLLNNLLHSKTFSMKGSHATETKKKFHCVAMLQF